MEITVLEPNRPLFEIPSRGITAEDSRIGGEQTGDAGRLPPSRKPKLGSSLVLETAAQTRSRSRASLPAVEAGLPLILPHNRVVTSF
jgi:hypothetical protein